jgi:four helix bundle protein
MAGDYRDLGAWREGVALLAEIHLLVKRLPAHEREFLGDRIFKAAVAVPARISEGQESGDRAEFLRHLRAAGAALSELGTLLILAEQQGHVTPVELESLEQACAEAAKPLRGLLEKVRRDVEILRPGETPAAP